MNIHCASPRDGQKTFGEHVAIGGRDTHVWRQGSEIGKKLLLHAQVEVEWRWR